MAPRRRYRTTSPVTTPRPLRSRSGTFGSSIPLAIYAATASARLRQLGITAPGATIALAGGLLASAGLGLSSLTAWTLSRPEVTSDAALVRALYYLTYLTGGPWHVVTLGLLIAGIAVPGLIVGLLPRAGRVDRPRHRGTRRTDHTGADLAGTVATVAGRPVHRTDLADRGRCAAPAAPTEQAGGRGGGGAMTNNCSSERTGASSWRQVSRSKAATVPTMCDSMAARATSGFCDRMAVPMTAWSWLRSWIELRELLDTTDRGDKEVREVPHPLAEICHYPGM